MTASEIAKENDISCLTNNGSDDINNPSSQLKHANEPLLDSPWKNDIACLEAETSAILQRYGKSRSGTKKKIVSTSGKTHRGTAVRPQTQSSAMRRSGGVDAADIGNDRPFTSRSRKDATLLQQNSIDEECRMFKADGTASNLLRNKISSAISTSEFDSVSCLLASGKTESLFKHQNGKSNAKRHGDETSSFLFESSPHMVSVMSFHKSPATKAAKRHNSLDEAIDPTKPRSLSLRNIEYTGITKGSSKHDRPNTTSAQSKGSSMTEVEMPKSDKRVCFNCWSAGDGETCSIHKDTTPSESNAQQNLSMCKNWGVGYLRRKYRSEEIEEQFSKKSQSLVYDKSQRRYRTVEEPKHPIYQLLTRHIARLNFTCQRRQNIRFWFRSFISKLKEGSIPGKRSNTSAQVLRLKCTIGNLMAVRKLSKSVMGQHPKAPVTGTTMKEKLGLEQVLAERTFVIDGVEQKQTIILAGPIPVPKALYKPRKYEPLPPKRFVLSEQNDCEPDKSDVETIDGLNFTSTLLNSKQYATFGRKRAHENLAVGGLSAEILVSQQFTKRFPPHYKNFTCAYDGIVIPPKTSNSSNFPTLDVPPGKIPYIYRKLVTPLDNRLPPTVMTKTGLGPEDRHFFGPNRPEQTGEKENFGFPTSTWNPMPFIDDRIDTNSFRPSESIATSNLPQLTPMRTMRVDETYPFRKEQSRKNSVDDLFHLLLSNGDCSCNKLQMFTCVGSQQVGYFMQNGDSSLPIGRVVTKVVRSWAFLQDDPVNTSEDVYNTNEEKMTYNEERRPLGLGGVVFGERPRHSESMPSGVLTKNSTKEVRRAILKRMNLSPINAATTPATAVVDNDEVDVGEVHMPELQHDKTEISHKSKPQQNHASSDQNPDSSHPSLIIDDSDGDFANSKPIGTSVDERNSSINAAIPASISQMVCESMKTLPSQPEDLIRLGMGIGASLGAQVLLNRSSQAQKDREHTGEASQPSSNLDDSSETTPLHKAHSTEGQTRNTKTKNRSVTNSTEDSKVTPNHSNCVNIAPSKPKSQGLLEIIASTRIGTRYTDYLPFTFNLPSTRSIHPQKPRSSNDEWKETSYNPWTHGYDPTSTQFLQSLTQETKRWPLPNNKLSEPAFGNTDKEFAMLCSFVRHGKYRELEDMMNHPDWKLPIDYCDESGNTLLMIACQNGNRRIAKLCLRRGSQINLQNLNGNSCLHFAFGYGFGELGDYLISKGADDSIQNANGLTCYEGLSMDSKA